MHKDRQILTLQQAKKEHEKDKQTNHPDRLHSTIGLIVDASGAYRYEKNRDFTQKIKIIDATNQNEPLQVYIWSGQKEDLTLNLKIGDIIYLNNFKFELYQDKLQAKKVYKNEDSYFRIFSGSPDTSNYSPIDKKVGLDDQDGKILNSINALRGFSKTYFSKHKVPILFKEGKKTPQKVSSSDFDMILRVIECVDQSDHYRIRLTNEKDEFFLNYPRSIHPGVYKIRSVADCKWEDKVCSLTGNDYTFFIEISSWMLSYDPKEWEKLAPTPETTVKKVRRGRIESKVLSASKKIKKMTLKDLFSKDTHEEEVRVTCQVMDVCTSFEDALKKYDKENRTQKNTVSETGEYIYSIHLLLSDNSLNGQVSNAYIYTFDGRGIEFLPDLEPSKIYGRNTLDYKENYENFVNRLIEESDVNSTPVELVLSPLFNGKQTIYRVVDTQLLF